MRNSSSEKKRHILNLDMDYMEYSKIVEVSEYDDSETLSYNKRTTDKENKFSM